MVVPEAVGGVAVNAVKLEVEGEGGAGHEALELGGAHVLDMHEAHVVGDDGGDVLDGFVRVAEAAEDGFGHFGAEGVVAVEAVALLFLVPGLGGGLGDVVEEDGEAEGEVVAFGEVRVFLAEEVESDAGVGVDIAFGVEFGRLLAASEGAQLGEELVGEAGVHEEVETAGAGGVGDDFGEFLADPFGGDAGEKGGVFLEGGEGVFLDGESGAEGEADGAEEAEGVFAEAFGGVADGAEGFAFEVFEAADVVDDLAGEGILEEAVDGEVAAAGVFLRDGEGDGVGAAVVGVGAVGSEGGDFGGEAGAVRILGALTMTTPKWAPTASARGKRARSSSGVAEVARSWSLGAWPRSWSRTQPPARRTT